MKSTTICCGTLIVGHPFNWQLNSILFVSISFMHFCFFIAFNLHLYDSIHIILDHYFLILAQMARDKWSYCFQSVCESAVYIPAHSASVHRNHVFFSLSAFRFHCWTCAFYFINSFEPVNFNFETNISNFFFYHFLLSIYSFVCTIHNIWYHAISVAIEKKIWCAYLSSLLLGILFKLYFFLLLRFVYSLFS